MITGRMRRHSHSATSDETSYAMSTEFLRKTADQFYSEIMAKTMMTTVTIPLGKSNEATSVLHEFVHVRIHLPRGGRAEGSRCITIGRFSRPGIVDNVILRILRQAFARFNLLEHFGMRNVTGDDDCSV